MVINQQRDKPTSRRFQPHRDGRRFATCGKSTAPADRQRFRTLCQPQLPILPPKGSTSKFSTTTTVLFLEVGVACTPCPEVGESFLQISQPLLQRHTAYLVKELQVFLFFPLGKHPRCLFVVNSLLSLVPSFSASMQRLIIDQPNATQCAVQELFLFRRWVKAIAVGSLCHALHSTVFHVKPC